MPGSCHICKNIYNLYWYEGYGWERYSQAAALRPSSCITSCAPFDSSILAERPSPSSSSRAFCVFQKRLSHELRRQNASKFSGSPKSSPQVPSTIDSNSQKIDEHHLRSCSRTSFSANSIDQLSPWSIKRVTFPTVASQLPRMSNVMLHHSLMVQARMS